MVSGSRRTPTGGYSLGSTSSSLSWMLITLLTRRGHVTGLTGFLLVHCALFLAFTFNAVGNASVNVLTITSVTAGLAVLAWLHEKI